MSAHRVNEVLIPLSATALFVYARSLRRPCSCTIRDESNVWLFDVYDAAVARWKKSEAYQKGKKAGLWMDEKVYKVKSVFLTLACIFSSSFPLYLVCLPLSVITAFSRLTLCFLLP